MSEHQISEADYWLNTHRVSETWRLVDMLRDELVRVCGRVTKLHDANVRLGEQNAQLRKRARSLADALRAKHGGTWLVVADSDTADYLLLGVFPSFGAATEYVGTVNPWMHIVRFDGEKEIEHYEQERATPGTWVQYVDIRPDIGIWRRPEPHVSEATADRG